MPDLVKHVGRNDGDSRLAEILLDVVDLQVEYRTSKGDQVHAVSGVSFDVRRGETLGVVGESGCGKSSVARAIVQAPRPTGGRVDFDGTDLCALSASELRMVRPRLQMIYQDPISSLNPRRTVADIVGDPLVVWGRSAERRELVTKVLSAVGLDPDSVWGRRPSEFSGGQCQRIAIARALVLRPAMLICDEPVSALDMSVQAQILNLFEDLKLEYGLTIMFISHDLGAVRNVSDRVAVMYLGRLCEIASARRIYESASHPYTRMLLAAASGQGRRLVSGEVPSALQPPPGCRFNTRCPLASRECVDETPALSELSPGHWVACHHPVQPQPTA